MFARVITWGIENPVVVSREALMDTFVEAQLRGTISDAALGRQS